MGKTAVPKSPDPMQTAQAQSTANTAAIRESAKVSAVDQASPWGNTTYQRDANGVPIKQTITLDPAGQTFFDTSNTIKNALAGKAQGYLNYLPNSQFTGPGDTAGDAVANALYQRKLGMVQPELDRADNQLKVQLSERGIPIGSEIYNNETDRLAKARGDTLASLSQDATLAGGQEYDRQLQDALTLRNQPFNEVSAFLQGAPAMPTPQFQQTPSYNVQAPDIAGLINQNYANQVNAANAANSSFANGLFGLGSAAIGAFSDRRLKTDIRRVGKTEGGLPIYTYRFKSGGPVQMGVMAQDVEQVTPAAVHSVNGWKTVDYRMVA